MSSKELLHKYRPDSKPYEELYKWFHANPELSFYEHETAKKIVEHLSKFQPKGYEITEQIGGTGVAAVLRNGDGPTIGLRADMDALPVKELTGLPYASTKKMTFEGRSDTPVMHACGHDFHMTSALAAAETLFKARSEWSGTLVLFFQPAEEKGAGAQAMVDDGLYTKHKIPVADIYLSAHVMPYRSGKVSVKSGLLASSADSYRVDFHGRGGHASQPHLCIDPIQMAASAVNRFNTIIPRNVAASEMAVITVPVFQAGSAENVIPDDAMIKVDMRANSTHVREVINKGFARVCRAESEASGSLQEPTITRLRSFPVTDNDPEAAEKLKGTFEEYFGDDHVPDAMMQGSEDFPILATSQNKPYVFFIYGGTEQKFYDTLEKEGKLSELPINHSGKFGPALQPTLDVAIDAMALAPLTWLAKR